MSDPIIGLIMLGLIVIAIMMGFPTAFTLMGLGMLFGFLAFWDPSQYWFDNRVFDLLVQRTYGTMNNDVLIAIPLFVFMGYVIERAALVDKMFHSVQLALRRLPGSLAVTTLMVCAFWGMASGIVGAVVVLMGVIALRPMLNAGYDVRFASGAITAGGTLGILIPPSVMLIVYAAVAGQSIVKLYAAAFLPGFFLASLYIVYILVLAVLKPKLAPKLSADRYRVAVPDWLARIQGARSTILPGLIMAALRPQSRTRAAGSDGMSASRGLLVNNLMAALMPLAVVTAIFGATWWYFMIYHAPAAVPATGPAVMEQPLNEEGELPESLGAEPPEELQELGVYSDTPEQGLPSERGQLEEFGGGLQAQDGGATSRTPDFEVWFWGLAASLGLLLLVYYRQMDGEQLEILKMVATSVLPLGVLIFVVLSVILFGITTATESAGMGALGALYLATIQRYGRRTLWASLAGFAIGCVLGSSRGDALTLIISGTLGALFLGTAVPWLWDLSTERRLLQMLKESTFLTARTTAMVCWLFVGSALFSAVFALHGGQQLVESWVLGLDLSPLQFMILAQAIIFLLGWPLEWTEIIVIFVPIFIPLLAHFDVDPVLFGIMVAINLQAAFLSPPVAMSAFYLKGVAPAHVTLNQIFAGMMPYMLIVLLCLVAIYIWPGMALWLPEFLYGR